MSTSINKIHVSIAMVIGIILGSSVTYAALKSNTQLSTTLQVQLSQENDELQSEIQKIQEDFDQQKQSSLQASQEQQDKIESLTQELSQLK